MANAKYSKYAKNAKGVKNAKKKGSTSERKGMTVKKGVIIGLLSLTFMFFSSIFIFLNFYTPPAKAMEDEGFPILGDISDIIGGDENSPNNASAVTSNGQTKDLFYNFLICGRDNLSGNTDTIIIVSFDVKNKQLAVLQFPRDSYINNSNSLKKVNAVFSYSYAASVKAGNKKDDAINDGLKTLRSTVRQTLGIPIHYAVYVDLAGFKEIVDIVGGVEVDVPMDMFYEDPEQNLYINLQKGVQILDGKKAEQFVRFRSGYDDQDLGRIHAQQQFASALIQKCFKLSLLQIAQMTDAAYKYVVTDLSVANLGYFGKELINLDLENIIFETVPGEAVYTPNRVWYYTIDKEKTMEIVNKYHNWYKEDLTPDKFDIVAAR